MNEIRIIGFSLICQMYSLSPYPCHSDHLQTIFLDIFHKRTKPVCKYTDKNLIVKLLNLESSIRLYESKSSRNEQSTRHCQVESQQKETKGSLLRRCANDSSRKHSCSSEREDCVTNYMRTNAKGKVSIKKAFLP